MRKLGDSDKNMPEVKQAGVSNYCGGFSSKNGNEVLLVNGGSLPI